jgi:hypothetical protein
MRLNLFFFVSLIVATSFLSASGQKLISNSSVTGLCYAGTKINRVYIPPPDEFLRKSSTNSGGSITVYYTGFTTQARKAVENAKTILEGMLPADTRLTVATSWEKISSTGVLGSSRVTGFAPGWFINALNPLAVYPVGLAEKIAGTSLNDDVQGDIQLIINSSAKWYLGTDGATPPDRYDLVTVVIHEICHGLGFFDSMDTENNSGFYGFGAMPLIYDTFVEDVKRNKLTDTLKYLNNSKELYNQYTGGDLYFNGPVLNKYLPVTRTKLFAPAEWDNGSSISHLDEETYPNSSTFPNKNALMTPYIDFGEAIHDPGKLTFSILGDLGWINTRIVHKKIFDKEDPVSDIELQIEIKSDTLYNRNKIGVVYSYDKFISTDTLYLSSPASDDIFKTIIDVPSYNIELQYYFFAEDYFLRLYRSPSLYSRDRYKVYFGIDTVKPVINHEPLDYFLESVDSIRFNATATDNIGIDTVYIEYKLNTGNPQYIGLKAGPADSYSIILNAKKLSLNGGDIISYRIFAVDSAKRPNTSVFPKSDYFKIKIEDIAETLESYATDFRNAASDFFSVGFEIARPAGFNKFGLHTKHPYESPEDNNKTINYTSMLRHPLKYNESGMLISFSEVVLVEPGENGSVYSESDFYDYVILEGSLDFGKTWFSLVDGYDSRYVASWETAYNSAISGDNSTYPGTESMLIKRSVFYKPADNGAANDTLLFRFRLYSDPFANGWGWVIEDLKINPLIDAVEKVTGESLKIFPNPGNGLIRVNTDMTGNNSGKPLRYSVFNSAGTGIKNGTLMQGTEDHIDITDQPSGLYFIIVFRDEGIVRFKYSLMK